MKHNTQSLKQYIKKKGIGYFLYSPSKEDLNAFEGIIYKNGVPNLSLLYSVATA